jgi:hypothetical protein
VGGWSARGTPRRARAGETREGGGVRCRKNTTHTPTHPPFARSTAAAAVTERIKRQERWGGVYARLRFAMCCSLARLPTSALSRGSCSHPSPFSLSLFCCSRACLFGDQK